VYPRRRIKALVNTPSMLLPVLTNPRKGIEDKEDNEGDLKGLFFNDK